MNPDSKNENKLPTAVAPPSPQWIELPADVTANILHRLEVVEILESAENVCTTWRRVCCDPSMWRALHIKRAEFWNEGIRKLWLRAVDRSQGQLQHLSIQFLPWVDPSIQSSWNVDMLNCIVERSNHLKRLTLHSWSGFKGKTAVVKAFNKIPHLEELCLIDSPQIEASDIENIGDSCPALKSFTFYQHGFIYNKHGVYSNRNEYAVAIAKSMPNLSHLCLMTNLINNEGLEVILDGCPKLDSLDLSLCDVVDLGGALGKRCSEQIKHLEFPLDSDAFLVFLRTPLIIDYTNHDVSDDDIVD